VYSRYEKRIREAGVVDFDDLLLLVVKLARRVAETLAGTGTLEARARRRVPGHQRAQYRIIRLLTDEHRNVCVVWDSASASVEGTLVQTTRGPKRIEAIEKGDAVIAGSGWERLTRDRRGRSSYRVRRHDREDSHRGRSRSPGDTESRDVRAFELDSAKYYVNLMYQERLGYRIGLTKVRGRRRAVTGVWLPERTNHETADRLWDSRRV